MTTTKKYELTSNSKEFYGKTLFQIRALFSFGTIAAGELGGFIEKEENLAQVSGNAWVSGDAQVSGNAWVSGDAQVSGNAWVSGDARVSGNAWVSGDARVYGDARVSGNAWVSGDAQVSGNAWVSGDAQVSGNARVSAKASFTLGWFIGGDDSGKITNITDKTGSSYWRNQYVLGSYEIESIEEEKPVKKFVEVDGKKYEFIEVTE